MPGTVAITFSDTAGRDSAVSVGTPLPVALAGGTPAGQTPPASEAPVPIGGLYSTAGAMPTLTAGQRGNAELDDRGNLRVTVAGVAANFTTSPGIVLYSRAASTNSSGLSNVGSLATTNFLWTGAIAVAQTGDTNGAVVQSGAMAASRWNYPAIASGIVSSAAEFTIIAAGGAGVRNFLSSLTIGHDLLSAGVEFVIRDGAAGTILYRGKLQTPATEGVPYVPPSPLRGTANTAMIGQLLTAVTGGVYFNASGFVGT